MTDAQPTRALAGFYANLRYESLPGLDAARFQDALSREEFVEKSRGSAAGLLAAAA